MIHQTIPSWVPCSLHRDKILKVRNTNAKSLSACTLSGRLPCCTRHGLTTSNNRRNQTESAAAKRNVRLYRRRALELFVLKYLKSIPELETDDVIAHPSTPETQQQQHNWQRAERQNTANKTIPFAKLTMVELLIALRPLRQRQEFFRVHPRPTKPLINSYQNNPPAHTDMVESRQRRK